MESVRKTSAGYTRGAEVARGESAIADSGARFSIVKATADYVVVDKPHGMLTVPSRMGDTDPRPCLGRLLEKEFGAILPVHRLDFEVSGVVIYARNAQAHKVLNSAFENRKAKKTYQALTEGLSPSGWLPGQTETWRSKIQRGKKRSFFAPYGQDAETLARWEGIRVWGDQDLLGWTLFPVTGRPHQLRLELSSRGFPIWGDTLYGSKAKLGSGDSSPVGSVNKSGGISGSASGGYSGTGGIALRAVSLELPDSVRQSLKEIPESFEVASLEEYLKGVIKPDVQGVG